MSEMYISAYCLMRNHFHLVIQVREDENKATQAFSNLFNAYAKAYNKQQNRTGSLFEKHFKRKRLKDDKQLKDLIVYVHTNPAHHQVNSNYINYPFSSCSGYFLNKKNTLIGPVRKEIIALFDNIENMKYVHDQKHPDSNSETVDLQGSEDLAGQSTMRDKFVSYIHVLQDKITSTLEKVDGKATFQEDAWEREEGGGGRTRVIENGGVFEKGGVNISTVHGPLAPAMQKYFNVGDIDFFACGLSLVLHPKNPFVPTVHANWRYFEMYEKDGTLVDSWFGGGQDLTPYYLFEEDAVHFHQTCKTVCDAHDPAFYPDFKAKCDAYFYNSHRGEGRGIGGLFFDYCKADDNRDMQDWYNFVTAVGDSFLEAYVPIVEKRKDLPYGEKERNWQEVRRGRYVEFNLVHDKGTLFGLKTNGRIESILMSLPPVVQWKYDHHPEPGSEEEKLVKVLENPRNWV